MANQSNTGSTPRSAPANRRPNTGRYAAIMVLGGLAGLVGAYLMLTNLRSNPTLFYIGLTLAGVGFPAGFVSAIIRSNIRNRMPRKR